MGDITFISLQGILPELFLAAIAVFLLMVTVFKCKTVCPSMLGGALFALAGTGYYLSTKIGHAPTSYFNGMFVSNDFVIFAKMLILSATALVLLISGNWLRERGDTPSEFLVLMLLSVLGLMLMVSAGDLLAIYMGLEMSSLALYVLAAFDRDQTKSNEAGLKYFVLGALASGMMLYGMSLVYGFAGTTSFEGLAKLFAESGAPASKGVLAGLTLIMIGFCFKLSAVPFHMWTPDVYEGAPTPVTAFFAGAPKIAAMALFIRLLMQPFGELIGGWQQIVDFVAVASMLVGALAAMMQSNIKRLLAYSSIGHVGFMLMAIAADNAMGAQAILIYLSTYIFMNAGMFGCVMLMRRKGHHVEQIGDLAGLAQTRPLMAVTIAAFMFSMAGIPPLAGFFGKFYVVLAAIQAGLSWLAVVGVATTVISCFYYLKVVKVMYFDNPAEAFDRHAPVMLKTGIAIGAAFTLLFFLVPTPLVTAAQAAAEALLTK
jgi:NADH-quinone oxidoreductase subunit N